MRIVAETEDGRAIVLMSKKDMQLIGEVFAIPKQNDPVIRPRIGDTVSITIGSEEK